jgi:hypothetical protein
MNAAIVFSVCATIACRPLSRFAGNDIALAA